MKTFYNSTTGLGIVVEDSESIENFPGYQETPKATTRGDVIERRLKLLFDSDWTASTDRTMTDAEREYRQALRDITDQEAFTEGRYDDIIWPSIILSQG
jgi:hypothetical protein